MTGLNRNESFYCKDERQFKDMWDLCVEKAPDGGIHYLELRFDSEICRGDIWLCVSAAKEKGYIPIVDWGTGDDYRHMRLINDLRREGCVIKGSCGAEEEMYQDLMAAEKLDWITGVEPDSERYDQLCGTYGKAYIDQICKENPRRMREGEPILRV